MAIVEENRDMQDLTFTLHPFFSSFDSPYKKSGIDFYIWLLEEKVQEIWAEKFKSKLTNIAWGESENIPIQDEILAFISLVLQDSLFFPRLSTRQF